MEAFVDTEYAYSNRAEAQGFIEAFISIYGDDINVLMGFDDDLRSQPSTKST